MKKDILILWVVGISVVTFVIFLILSELKILGGALSDWLNNDPDPAGTAKTNWFLTAIAGLLLIF